MFFSKNQFGFVRGSSTSDVINYLISEITEDINDSRKALAIFLDLARAFDTVHSTDWCTGTLQGERHCAGYFQDLFSRSILIQSAIHD